MSWNRARRIYRAAAYYVVPPFQKQHVEPAVAKLFGASLDAAGTSTQRFAYRRTRGTAARRLRPRVAVGLCTSAAIRRTVRIARTARTRGLDLRSVWHSGS